MHDQLLIDDQFPDFTQSFGDWLTPEFQTALASKFQQRLEALQNHLAGFHQAVVFKSQNPEGFANLRQTQPYLTWQEIDKLKKHLQKIDASDWSPEQRLGFVNNCYLLTLCSPNTGGVNIDFLAGKKAHRREFGGGAGQPMIRALGKIDEQLPTILDATAGLGGDSFVMASLGFQVTMLERDPFVSALLKDALNRAHTDSFQSPPATDTQAILQRLQLITTNSIEHLHHLAQQPEANRPQTIYLDPMYPEKKKQSATKKEMAALHIQVGPDLDSEHLLDAAIQAASFRVVVKRPKGAEPLKSAHYLPTTEISSPNTRYDIYVKKALKLIN